MNSVAVAQIPKASIPITIALPEISCVWRGEAAETFSGVTFINSFISVRPSAVQCPRLVAWRLESRIISQIVMMLAKTASGTMIA